MLFFPIQQELDCISEDGEILGKIRFDDAQRKHIFYATNDASTTPSHQEAIRQRLDGLDEGRFQIPMQDDD